MSLETRVRELEEELQKAHQTIANLSKALSEFTGYLHVQIQRKLDLLIDNNGKGRAGNGGNDISCMENTTSVKKAPAPSPPLPSSSVDSLIKKVNELQATVDRIEGKISGPQRDVKDRLIEMSENIESIKKTVGELEQKTATQTENPKIEDELNIVKVKLDELQGMAKNSDNALMQQLKSQLGTERKKSEKNSQLITQMHTMIKDIGTERTKQKETENRVAKILKGPLASFKRQVTIINDKVCIGERTFDLKEFESTMQCTPWIVFPDGYEVKCCECEEINSLECLWEDGVSADCPKCETLTLLRQAKQGHEWIYFSDCFHYEEVKLRTRPPKCGVCAEEGPCEGNKEAFIRIPELSKTNKVYENRRTLGYIMHTVDTIKDKITPENVEEDAGAELIDDTMITCAICCEIFHRPVNVTPCNHKFCAACIYRWLGSHSSCPSCRRSASISNTSPDAFVAEIADKFLAKFPARKRALSVLEELDETVQRLQPRSHGSVNFQRNNTDFYRRYLDE